MRTPEVGRAPALREAQAERERMVALYQRLRADFDNYKPQESGGGLEGDGDRGYH